MSLYEKLLKIFNPDSNYNLRPIDLIAPIPFQQELQQLYDNIDLMLGQGNKKVITIASSNHGEGSSTIASYFALLLAKNLEYSKCGSPQSLAKKILLIDGNFRHPSIHLFFDLENKVGFSELIQEKTNIEQALNHVQNVNLTIATTGEAIDRPFHPESLKRIMGNFKLNYDVIIIDSAPILPYLDTLIITKYCDGLILNVRAGVTRREIINKAKLKLLEANLNVLGVVLNKREYYIPNMIYSHI